MNRISNKIQECDYFIDVDLKLNFFFSAAIIILIILKKY